MYFDALTLAAITDELRTTILGGRIQRVLLPDALSIGLEVYAHRQRHQLLASVHPQLARVHLVGGKLSRGVEQPTPLLLLLRKYLAGGRIVAIDHPPLERILILTVSIVKEAELRNSLERECPHETEDAPDPATPPLETRVRLMIETMGRWSNIILVDEEDIILESIRRVNAQMSHRVILPKVAYAGPPPQNKRDPTMANAGEMSDLIAREPDLVRALVGGYGGVSPQVAREVVHRAAQQVPTQSPVVAIQPGRNERVSLRALAACLRDLWTAPWEPSLVPNPNEPGPAGPQAYAPYRITHMAGAQPQASMSAALETFYAAHQDLTAHHQRREAVQEQLGAARARLERQLDQLRTEQERTRNLDQVRWEGEMIFAFLHTLAPGQETLEVEGTTIALDPDRTPVECAQERFRRYEKAKSGAVHVAERLRDTETRLAGLEQLSALLDVADEREQIEQIAREAEAQGYLAATRQPAGRKKAQAGKRQKKKLPPSPRIRPLRLISSDGFALYVGRSAEQNAEVTFTIGRPDDLWLHARAIPGAHVIVRTAGREVPEATLEEAAGLAAHFSRGQAEARVEVDIARRKSVRKIPGGPPGLVTYHAERTLRVAPRPPWGR
ncbi:MAG: fibronectin/fibrinogen-binding protein [Chloroflexaceae bacterium]|nr:fibronectin/fibrinogen-binding protein [Chloroflexaceae bacterium]